MGCGVILTPDGAGGLAVRGDAQHPANFGRLCSKGAARGETVGLEGHLLAPRVFGQEVGWDAARDLVAGRIGRPGMGPFSVTGQPGLKAVEMFRLVADGRIMAIWILHTNPVVSMPEADLVAKALRACPVVVVQEMTSETDTARPKHVLLPATNWAEKDGTVTKSERRISRRRAMRPAPRQARDDWRILEDVAGRKG
jgi:anaerobic selenocysteine-containing dehydrogenase